VTAAVTAILESRSVVEFLKVEIQEKQQQRIVGLLAVYFLALMVQSLLDANFAAR